MTHKIDREHLFDTARPTFGGYTNSRIQGIDTILDAFEAGNFDKDEEAYMLATATWESAKTMQAVRETLATTDDQAISRLENAWRTGKLTWVKTPYWRKDAEGKSWFGRGLVQITHKANYDRLGKAIGVDLVSNPSRALELPVAIKIMTTGMKLGLFTTGKLDQYLDGVDESWAEDYREFVNARRIINGKDRAEEIAKLAMMFKSGIRYV